MREEKSSKSAGTLFQVGIVSREFRKVSIQVCCVKIHHKAVTQVKVSKNAQVIRYTLEIVKVLASYVTALWCIFCTTQVLKNSFSFYNKIRNKIAVF